MRKIVIIIRMIVLIILAVCDLFAMCYRQVREFGDVVSLSQVCSWLHAKAKNATMGVVWYCTL